jgi:hypothetical protein
MTKDLRDILKQVYEKRGRTMRVTEKRLQEKLANINRRVCTSYEIDNAPHEGGWELTSNGRSHVVKSRCSPKEMLAYLEGIELLVNYLRWPFPGTPLCGYPAGLINHLP